MIKLQNIDLVISNKKILTNINIFVKDHEFICIVGQSGSGKTSILKVISGLEKPTRGTMEVGSAVSMVFQDAALMPWLKVIENIEFPFKIAGLKPDHKMIQEAINEMGLRGMEQKYPRDLSGGQDQRVGIARALAVNRDILLLDEPFSALDVKTEIELSEDLMRLWNKHKLTVVMVSHSVESAVAMADRILVVEQGSIRKEIPVQMDRPRRLDDKNYQKLVEHIKEIIEH